MALVVAVSIVFAGLALILIPSLVNNPHAEVSITRVISIKKSFSGIPERPLDQSIFSNSITLKNRKPERSKTPLIKKIWSSKISDVGRQSTPEFCGSFILTGSLDGTVLVQDVSTGKNIFETKVKPPAARRGLTCTKGDNQTFQVFVPSGDGLVVFALSAQEFKKENILGNGLVYVPPLISKDTVVVAQMNPSIVLGFNRVSRKEVWRTQLNEFPAGANVWSGMSLARDGSLAVIATGSPYGWDRLSTQKTNNKYKNTNSLVFMDPKTGDILSSIQAVKDDTWDVDMVGMPLVLNSEKNYSVIALNKLKGAIKVTGTLDDAGFNMTEFVNSSEIAEVEPFTALNKDYINSFLVGQVPPVLKRVRVFNGYSGGPQWPGLIYSETENLIVFAENTLNWFGHFFDLEPSGISFSDVPHIDQCTQCHTLDGRVVKQGAPSSFIPSLFLTSQIFSSDSLGRYLGTNNAHSQVNLMPEQLAKLYASIEKIDLQVLDTENFNAVSFFDTRFHSELDGSFQRTLSNQSTAILRAIDVDTFKEIWRVSFGKNGPDQCKIPGDGGTASQGGLGLADNFVVSADMCGKIVAYSLDDGSMVGVIGDLPGAGTAPPLAIKIEGKRLLAFPSAESSGASFISVYEIEGEKSGAH